jgi:hypothetical protein
MKLEIEWHSPRLASYKLAGSFDAQDFDGNAQPHELMLILQLGEPSYSREAVIHHNQWRVRTSWLWLGPNGEDPDVPEGHHPEEASADDSAPGIICAISARPGPLHLGWLAFCMGGIVLGWLRRRHRR